MILITHHIHEILPEIERVVLMKDGRIQDDNPKREVFNEQSLSALFGTYRIVIAGFSWSWPSLFKEKHSLFS